jgi:phage baseplate assembly protein W
MAITTSNIAEYVDLDFVFKSNPNTGDLGIKQQINAVKQSILHILHTNHGEKVFEPLFGANLIQFLFENNGLITSIAIADSIKEAIINYEPRVEVLNVKVNNNPDANSIEITLVVKIISTNQITSIATSLERLR